MKNFRKILAHLWADVQACFFLKASLSQKNLITKFHHNFILKCLVTKSSHKVLVTKFWSKNFLIILFAEFKSQNSSRTILVTTFLSLLSLPS